MAFADNVVGVGQIPEGSLTAAYLLSPFSVNRKVYRLDFTGESLNAPIDWAAVKKFVATEPAFASAVQ